MTGCSLVVREEALVPSVEAAIDIKFHIAIMRATSKE